MNNKVVITVLVLLSGLAIWSCSQKEGERCQLDRDCEPLVCVGESDDGDTDGHCCPVCSSGNEFWDLDEEVCGCGSSSSDGDGDVDGDADGDADGDSDGDADGDAEDDGDV
mgnify:CR=1 FL=1